MKKPLLLLVVDGNVGGIKIQNQGFRRLLETLKKQLTEQLFNPLGIPGDFSVPVLDFFIQLMTEFQSVQGALLGCWRFIIPPAYILKQWIIAQLSMIIEIFIALTDSVDSLVSEEQPDYV